jgi:hypothetical protein
MLDVTLSTSFVPGANVKGHASGGNWMFLRPALAAGEVICLGDPGATTLATLQQFSRSVRVIRPGFDDLEALSSRAGSADVLLIAGWQATWRLGRDRRLRSLVRRALKDDALVYYEYLGSYDPLCGGQLLEGDGQRFALTPLGGELNTAVPAGDHAMRRLLRQRQPSQPPTAETLRTLARRARTWMGGDRAGSMVTWARRRIQSRVSWADRLVDRHGVLLGAPAAGLGESPPQYLCDVAANDGIDLRGYRWGLAANGEYASRKLIFYLDDRASGPGSRPRYVAKLVRHPWLNGRLENEHRALSRLCADDVVDSETVPHPAFFGYHAGLAILGETIVEGTPFAQHTDATPDCPYLDEAVEWFTTLATRTAARQALPPARVTTTLEWLFGRFDELYHPEPGERRFLAEQIEAIGAGAQTLPLTFQHGDPGMWNMLVTPSRRVALLDWEAAETQGMPLWDLLYFLRSYVVRAARLGGGRRSLEGIAAELLRDTPISRMVAASTRRYCHRIRLPESLVEPLFYACWMHRAIKEATRLPADQLSSGHYVNLLQLMIARRQAPGLRQLFAC